MKGKAPDCIRATLAALAALPGVHVHSYGKTPKPQRKIGHVTVTAESREQLMARLAPVRVLVEQYAS